MQCHIVLLVGLLQLADADDSVLAMTRSHTEDAQANATAQAVRLTQKRDGDGFPAKDDWDRAKAVRFDRDWQGQNADAQRSTEVRLLWTAETLFVKFHCRYRTISVFPDARSDGFRNGMWDRDVAEIFLQPDASDPWLYREFEVSPTGQWIDLAVSHRQTEELRSGLKRRVVRDDKAMTWTAEFAIPMKSLTAQFDPKRAWRVNFYRIEGQAEPRFYAAWNPTHSEKPNFHVPSAFGTLIFRE